MNALLTREIVERALEERHRALRAIENDVPLSLYDALVEKTAYERTFLRDACERALEESESRAARILNPEYFIRKKLMVDLF